MPVEIRREEPAPLPPIESLVIRDCCVGVGRSIKVRPYTIPREDIALVVEFQDGSDLDMDFDSVRALRELCDQVLKAHEGHGLDTLFG